MQVGGFMQQFQMQPVFPDIKVKYKDIKDIERVKQLKRDLAYLSGDIILHAPSDFNYAKLNRLRLRIYKFSKKEGCNEYFTRVGNKKYVCLNASLLNRRYHAAILYALHGIAHSFSHLDAGAADEAFCEHVAYSILRRFTRIKGRDFSRRVVNGIITKTPHEYNEYYRASRKLENKRPGTMLKLNTKAKNKKISKKNQKRIFYRLVKRKRFDDMDLEPPNLEKGFRRI